MSDQHIQATPPTDAAHDPHHADAPAFTPAQWADFHKSDIGAGGAVIVLMTAIFSIGLALYTVIAIVVAQ